MSSVDYYDVQNMIRDARHEIRGEIRSEIQRAISELRDEINGLAGDATELRYRVEELERERREAMT